MVAKITLLALMLICLFGFKGLNQLENTNSKTVGDTIVWSANYHLEWEDFKGVPDNPNRYVKAHTNSGIFINQIRTTGKIPKYNVRACFIKSASWTKITDLEHLKHEQVHFDISELYARKLRKSFDSLNAAKVITTMQYRKISEANFTKWENYQDLYDKEVYDNEPKQQEWIEKITAELESLKKYQLK